jgi:hypothetical protein
MLSLKVITTLLLIILLSCNQKQIKQQQAMHKVDPRALSLNNQAIPLANHVDNPDSCEKAFSLLDSATKIDDSCFSCHFNKLIFLNVLEQSDRCISITNKLIRLQPYNTSLYLMRGGFYKQIKDTIASKRDFEKSLELCETILDTMDNKNRSFDIVLLDKALSLIMLDNQEKGNAVLKNLRDKQGNNYLKEYYGSLIDKSKDELLTFRGLDNAEGLSFPTKE